MRDLLDVRHAFRLMAASPGFTLLAVLPLAIGMGANIAIFSVVNAVLLHPLPYTDPDRLCFLSERAEQGGWNVAVSYSNLLDWQVRNHSFTGMAGFRGADWNLTGSGDAVRVRGRMVSADYFPVLGINLILGRNFLPEEDRLGGNPVVILNQEFWEEHFGADATIIGRALRIDDQSRTVIGIAPKGLRLFGEYDAYTPLGQWDNPMMRMRDSHPGIFVIARLKSGVTVERAFSDMRSIAQQLVKEYPKQNTGSSVTVQNLKTTLTKDVRPTMWMLTAAVACILLIACANVANLLLARGLLRQREVAIRTALGGTRVRIMRQFLMESLVVGLAAGLAGLALAVWGADALVAALADRLPSLHGEFLNTQVLLRKGAVSMDRTVLLFTLAASIVTGLLFGLVPAIDATRPRFFEVMKHGGRSLIGGGQRIRDALVVAEVALALILLAGAGLMIRSLQHLATVPPGFDPTNVVAMNIGLSPATLKDAHTIRIRMMQLVERIGTVPGVTAAAWNNDVPLSGDQFMAPFYVQGRPRPANQSSMQGGWVYAVTPEYLKVMRIPLLRGRFLDEGDTARSKRVVVVDEVLARSVFGNENAVGKAIVIAPSDRELPFEIVGVVGHVAHTGLDHATSGNQMYFSLLQVPDDFAATIATSSTMLIRTSVNSRSISKAVRDQVVGADRDQPVYNVRSMEQILSDTLAQRRVTTFLLEVAGSVALLLATMGIYAVISSLVGQRTREIGIRMALGARDNAVLRLVVAHGLLTTTAGIGLGIAIVIPLSRTASALLYGVKAYDPITLTSVSALLACVSFLATYAPARRAARIDPVDALRDE